MSGTGESWTPLDDSRWLIGGGAGPNGAASRLAIFDSTTNTTITLPARMREPRAWHSATVVSDGSVLLMGGRDGSGQPTATAERFDPATETLTAVDVPGAAARAGHTATLLTDGRVLIAGGQASDGRFAMTAEVWDLSAARLTRVAGALSRSRHAATLLSDGRVRLSSGRDGNAADEPPMVFDPRSNTISPFAPTSPDDGGALDVSEGRPSNGAIEIPVNTNVTLRFARLIDSVSISPETVVLSGPNGLVLTHLVIAESGRLLFIRPLDPLAPATTYRVTLAGVRGRDGFTLPTWTTGFTTTAPATTDSGDTEPWIPDAHDGWHTHRAPSPWQSLPALHAEPGATAVAGQVLTLDGRPLANVTLGVEDATTRSDGTGRFLLRLDRAQSARLELSIDGSTANRPGRTYGYFEYGLAVEAGITTVQPFTIWLPRLDVAHHVAIPSPTVSEVVITTPHIPGLELHLPPHTVIRNGGGEVVTEIGITPIPVDRPPFPLATNVDVPVYFTVQPGGAYVHTTGTGPKGAWLVYPNYRSAMAGQRVQFFHYDPSNKGWYVYGLGTVTPNAAQVVPDGTTRLYEFTGAMINSGNSPPGASPTSSGARVADPVDPSTGLFVMQKTDLYLPDVIPIALTRVYNSGDSLARSFGRGMTHPYAMFLWSAHEYTEVDLILPDGGKLHYVRTSPGTGVLDAVFVHQETPTTAASPTVFYKSVIVWNGRGWNLSLTNGTVYVFGEYAPLQAIRDRYGNTITVSHQTGQYGNVTRVTSPNGRWIAFTYDSNNRVSQATDNIGRTVRYSYSAGGNLTSATDPDGGITTYLWTASNQIGSIKDARDIVYLTNTYQNGRVASQTLADPNTTFRFAYTVDTAGSVSQTDVTDPRGLVHRLVFNSDHYVVTRTQALGLPEQRTFTIERRPGSNFVSAEIDALSRRTEYAYDGSGHVLSVTRLAGTNQANVARFTYEPRFFQMASVTDQMGHTASAAYDISGRLTSVTDPTGRAAAVTMNALGQITSLTDPLQHTWRFGYAGADLASIRDPDGAVQTLAVDAAGRFVAATDADGQAARYEWDALNRLTMVIDPIGGRTGLSYDRNGNVVGLTDAGYHTTAFAYDAFDQMSSRTDPLLHAESRQHDVNGNLSSVTDRKGQTSTYQYDTLDRLSRVTFADGATVSFERDRGDRVTRIDDSVNGSISRQYDLLDRVVQESTAQGSVSYAYDADGRRISMTVAGQSPVTYEYDAAHRVTALRQGNASVLLTYDGNGRRASMTLPNGVLASYDYDATSRLTQLVYRRDGVTLGDVAYGYDATGRRTSVSGSWARTGLPRAVASATYDAANRLTTWGASSFAHDLNGNALGDGVNLFSWNARNQLTTIQGAAPATFQYDATGRRRARTLGQSTTRFLYDGPDSVQEQSAAGFPTANLFTGLGIDETFARTDNAGTRTMLTDALGSVAALADESGSVQTSYTYQPYGATIATGAASGNASEFTGREDDATGLYFYRARYYDPARGRFISEDPIGFAGGVNMYAYARNQPTTRVDPTGTWDFPWHWEMTYEAAIEAGYSILDAIRLANGVGLVDRLSTQGADFHSANMHAMGGRKGNRYQTACEAYQSTSRQLLEDLMSGRIDRILHAIQDSLSPSHIGFEVWKGGLPGLGHARGDIPILPLDFTYVMLAQALSQQFLQDYRSGTLRDLGSYLGTNPCK